MDTATQNLITFSIDIGGSHIKAATLDEQSKIVQPYKKLPTPSPATPDAVMNTIKQLAEGLSFDRISAGFPGYVKNGVVETAPNLGTSNWKGVNFEQQLTQNLGKPARVANDADVLGLGVIDGKGFEMIITLGTGFGTGMYNNGKLLPHLEFSQMPYKKHKTIDSYIGNEALKKEGNKKWNKRLQNLLSMLKTVINYDTLYVGGGNAKKITFKVDENVKIVDNEEGIDGGVALWNQ